MKKILFGLIATVMLSFVGNANEFKSNKLLNSDPSLKVDEVTKVKINLDVTWGRKSKECHGFGICDVDVSIEIDNKIGNLFSGTNNGNFTLEFDEKGLKRINEIFQSNSILTIEEEYVLSEKVCRALELKSGYTLKKGKYKIQKNEIGTYYVSF